MADFGLKVSQPGADVGTATGNNLIITSSVPLLKIKQEGRITVAASPTGTAIPHGLPYIPICWCFKSSSGNMSFMHYDQSGDQFYVDATNLVIMPASSNDFYYYIFYDEMGNYA